MGRGMLDNVLMTNEVVEKLERFGRSGLCLKVDYEKAYDSVRWEFIYDMLQRLGFHIKWIQWIRGCMESTSVFVLVKSSPTKEFNPTRGLRQGDSLAPFLFIVVDEGLARLVRQTLKANALSRVKIGRNEIELCMLQFVNDTLFLCDDSFHNVVSMKAIPRGYELVSGLKINFHKSKLVGINVERIALACYAKTLNCTQMGVHFKYMGLEVGGNPKVLGANPK